MKRAELILSRVIEAIVALCLFAIFAMVVTLVVLRYFFNSSIPGANEFVTILFAYASSIGAALAIGRSEHIAIEFAVDRLPKSAKRWLVRLSVLLVGFLNVLLVVESIGWISVTGDFLMPSLGLPRWIAQLSVPIGCGLAAFYCGVRLVSAEGEERSEANT